MYSMVTFLANTIRSQLIMYGTVIKMAAFLRPNLSAKMPDGTAPTIAPIAKNDAIHVLWSPATGMMELGSSNCPWTGDVHDRPVPAAAALIHTVTLYQIEVTNVCDKFVWLMLSNFFSLVNLLIVFLFTMLNRQECGRVLNRKTKKSHLITKHSLSHQRPFALI